MSANWIDRMIASWENREPSDTEALSQDEGDFEDPFEGFDWSMQNTPNT